MWVRVVHMDPFLDTLKHHGSVSTQVSNQYQYNFQFYLSNVKQFIKKLLIQRLHLLPVVEEDSEQNDGKEVESKVVENQTVMSDDALLQLNYEFHHDRCGQLLGHPCLHDHLYVMYMQGCCLRVPDFHGQSNVPGI